MLTNWRMGLMRSTFLLLATVITGCSSARGADRQGQAVAETFREPPVVASSAGDLRISLTPKPSTVSVAGHRVMLMAYSGRYTPPTLRVHPGDTIRVRLANALAEPTNFHSHGLTVSPRSNSDNIFLRVAPSRTQDYE